MKVSVEGIPQGGPPDAGRGEEVNPQQVEECCEDGVYRGVVVRRRHWNRRKFYNSLGTKVPGMKIQLRTLQMKFHSPIWAP